MSDRPEEDVRESMQRREFLRLGAAGLAASAAGTNATSVPTRIDSTSAASARAAAQEAPPAGDLVDPATVPYETWLEPWTWRPSHWPMSLQSAFLPRSSLLFYQLYC